MKIKEIKIATLLIIFASFFASCTDEQGRKIFSGIVNAPPSSIERDVKGHEMIASIQANLYYARRSKQTTPGFGGRQPTYFGYTVGSRPTPIPLLQTIEIKKDENGALAIVSDRKAFDVIKGRYIYYILELKYYDVNGQMINHQFSSYDREDKDASMLDQHQTMFTIQNHSLSKEQLTYPMTLDSVYIPKYLYANGKKQRAGISAPTAVFAPEDATVEDAFPYDHSRAIAAVEATMSAKAEEAYTDPTDGKKYYLYRTRSSKELAEMTPQIYSYYYRDTDPVDQQIGKRLLQDDMNRKRLGKPVGLLRKERALEWGRPLDYLGFKGLLQFHESNITFQMRVAICHIIEAIGCNPNERCGKYISSENAPFVPNPSHKIPDSWNTYDLDYPIPFRVIADIDGDKAEFEKAIQRFYPEATSSDLRIMFESHYSDNPGQRSEVESDYFRKIPFVRF